MSQSDQLFCVDGGGAGQVAGPSVPIQLWARCVLWLLLIEVPLLLISGHNVQVVKVRVVIHSAARGESCQGQALPGGSVRLEAICWQL